MRDLVDRKERVDEHRVGRLDLQIRHRLAKLGLISARPSRRADATHLAPAETTHKHGDDGLVRPSNSPQLLRSDRHGQIDLLDVNDAAIANLDDCGRTRGRVGGDDEVGRAGGAQDRLGAAQADVERRDDAVQEDSERGYADGPASPSASIGRSRARRTDQTSRTTDVLRVALGQASCRALRCRPTIESEAIIHTIWLGIGSRSGMLSALSRQKSRMPWMTSGTMAPTSSPTSQAASS